MVGAGVLDGLAEVDEFDLEVGVQTDVLGLDVSVVDVVLLVEIVERLDDFG